MDLVRKVIRLLSGVLQGFYRGTIGLYGLRKGLSSRQGYKYFNCGHKCL